MVDTHSARPSASVVALALLVLALALWFGPLGVRSLIHSDEGRYAEIAREMLVSGDWVTPRLNGILYFEKPPLQYWATAAAFGLFGVDAWAARLWPALSGALAIAALWWVARRRFDAERALYASCVLGASAWWIANGHFLTLDMGLAAVLGIALLGFWTGARDDAPPRANLAGMMVCWSALGVATLAKGPVAIVLPAAALCLYTLAARDFSVWRRMRWLPGTVVYLAIAAPWFVVVSMRNPDFARFFFVHEHLERFLSTEHHRSGPLWYFVPVLAIGLMPWTTLLPGALRAAWRRTPGRFQPNRFLLAWSLVVFGFFSASGSKLPGYILPMFPALALLIGQRIAALSPRALARHAAAVGLLAMACCALLAWAPARLVPAGGDAASLARAFRSGLLGGALVIAVAALIATLWSTRGRKAAAVLTLSFGSIVGVQAMMIAHEAMAPLMSARTMVEAARGAIDPAATVYAIGTYDQSLPFYLGRPVTLVAWQDEFAMGLRIEPSRSLPTIDAFAAQWRSQPRAAALMSPDVHAQLLEDGLPMREMYRDARRVFVVRP